MPTIKQTILLVEDEALIAMKQKQKLEQEGFKVIHFFTGEQAIDFFLSHKEKIDLILMDIDLGKGLDGTDTAEKILSNQNIPILFLSSHIEKDIVEKTEKITNYGYVVKNSSFTVLYASIKTALKLFESNRDIQNKMDVINDSQLRLKRAELISKSGNWELNVESGEITASAGAENIYGLSGGNFDLEGIKSLRLKEYNSLFDNALKDLLDKGMPYDIEFKIRAEDTGKIKDIHSVAALDKEKGIVFGVIQDITDFKKVKEKEQGQQKNIKFLSQTAMHFVELPEDENIYTYIGEQLKKIICEDSYIVLNSVNEKTNKSIVQAVLGLGDFTEKLINMLGKDPVGMEFDIGGEIQYYSEGKGHFYDEGVYGILLETVPKVICTSIEKLLNIKDIYIVDLAKKGRFFGSVIIFLKNNSKKLKNRELIETFIKQASIAVQKRQAEKSLIESKEHFSTLFQKAPLGYQSLDEEGRFIEINETWMATLGYKREEVIGKWFGDFLAPEEIDAFSDLFPTFKAAGRIHSEFNMIHKNGELRFIGFDGRIRYKHDGSFERTHCILQDITDRKIAEKKIINLVAEKELILKDVHHRIKNNMNIMEALLRLQSDRVSPETSTILNDAAGRLQSMMLLYEKLYNSDNFGELSLKSYISSLVEENTKIFSDKAVFETDIEDISLKIELLSCLGITINELISNSMKYAFTKNIGIINIETSITGNIITLIYRDNGSGLPESFTFENSTGFGMQLVKMLVEQLEGTIKIIRGKGTKIVIEFSI